MVPCHLFIYFIEAEWRIYASLNWVIIGSDNGLSPVRRQAIIRTNAEILLIGTLGTNFSEILSEIHAFSFTKMHLKMSSGKWRPFCFGLNVLNKARNQVVLIFLLQFTFFYTLRFNEVERGYAGFTLSVCLSVDRIVSALYLQQYSSDPFHICTSYQATSEGVSRVMFV